jgi:hypothetical protein
MAAEDEAMLIGIIAKNQRGSFNRIRPRPDAARSKPVLPAQASASQGSTVYMRLPDASLQALFFEEFAMRAPKLGCSKIYNADAMHSTCVVVGTIFCLLAVRSKNCHRKLKQ